MLYVHATQHNEKLVSFESFEFIHSFIRLFAHFKLSNNFPDAILFQASDQFLDPWLDYNLSHIVSYSSSSDLTTKIAFRSQSDRQINNNVYYEFLSFVLLVAMETRSYEPASQW